MAKKRNDGKKLPSKTIKTAVSIRKGFEDSAKIVEKDKRELPKHVTKRKGNTKKPTLLLETYKCIDWFNEGKERKWIYQQLLETTNPNTGRKYSQRHVENIVNTSVAILKDYYQKATYKVIEIHIARYNQMLLEKLNRNYQQDIDDGVIQRKNLHKTMVNDLFAILQIMQQKEELIGIHRKRFKQILNIQNNVLLQQKIDEQNKQDNTIDLDKLSVEQLIELNQLYNAAEINEDELYNIQQTTTVSLLQSVDEQQNVKDVEYEDVTNIDSIEQYSSNSTVQGATLQQIQDKINNKLLKIQQNKIGRSIK